MVEYINPYLRFAWLQFYYKAPIIAVCMLGFDLGGFTSPARLGDYFVHPSSLKVIEVSPLSVYTVLGIVPAYPFRGRGLVLL